MKFKETQGFEAISNKFVISGQISNNQVIQINEKRNPQKTEFKDNVT